MGISAREEFGADKLAIAPFKFHRILSLPLIDPHRYSGPQMQLFQGGNNVKTSLGVCFALSRNYVSSYRGTAIMRKKMHATVF
jgi:hypothetical protein